VFLLRPRALANLYSLDRSTRGALIGASAGIRPEILIKLTPITHRTGPGIPIALESQTQAFGDVRQELAPGHPELERLLSGEIGFDEALVCS